MEQLVPLFVLFALGFGVGYSVRDWKSRVRRRRLLPIPPPNRSDQLRRSGAARVSASIARKRSTC